MRAQNRLLVCLILTLATGCVANHRLAEPAVPAKPWSDDAQDKRELLCGKWLGESKDKNGNLRLSLVERHQNGTYRIIFRFYQGRDYEESVEVGLWGISASTYFTLMRGWIIEGDFVPSDPTRAYYYDAYRVLNLNATSFNYESLETGNRFSSQRVGDDFRFFD